MDCSLEEEVLLKGNYKFRTLLVITRIVWLFIPVNFILKSMVIWLTDRRGKIAQVFLT